MSELEAAERGRHASELMFRRAQTPISEAPAFQALCALFVARVGDALSAVVGRAVPVELVSITQAHAMRPAERNEIICSFSMTPWRGIGFARFETQMLFGMLDAMYGGDWAKCATPPERALTAFELGLAGNVSGAVMVQLAETLAGIASFAPVLAATSALEAEQVPDTIDGSHVVVRMTMTDSGDILEAGLPLAGLEFARDKLVMTAQDMASIPDPAWRERFRRRVQTTPVELVACAPGPALTLLDVARFEVGTIVELDAEALHMVKFTANDEAMFSGRLGQSRGYFTVCVETTCPAPGSSQE